MDSSSLRIVIAIALFIHAIGHMQGVLVALGVFETDIWHSRSWLLDKVVEKKISKSISLFLWTICVLGFLATAFAFLDIVFPYDLWRPMAIGFSIPSILGVILYWNSFAAIFNKLGALAIDGAILIGLLLLNWPSDGVLGI